MQRVLLSTVTPVYHGAEYLRALTSRLDAVRTTWQESGAPIILAEAIFVDDGSIDESPHVLDGLRQAYPWLRVVTLSRNFGQHPATIAGILHSSGDWVATLDEDLQHPPERLETLLRAAASSSQDVVYARPQRGPHGSAWRDGASVSLKKFIGFLTRNPHVTKFSSFRLLRGDIARAAAAVSARNTYFDIALCWFTHRVSTVTIDMTDQRFRGTGRSGYTLLALVRHAQRLLISSDMRLASAGLLLGLGSALLSLVAGIAILLIKLSSPQSITLPGWTSVMLATLFFGGVFSAIGGILMKYVSLLLVQALGQPLFFVIDRGRDEQLAQYFSAQARHEDLPSLPRQG